MPDLTVFLIIVGMSAIQFFMSTRNHALWGIIIPMFFTVVMTWMFITNRIDNTIAFIVLLIVGLLLLIGEWGRGRKSFHKHRKGEMNKMKTKDLK